MSWSANQISDDALDGRVPIATLLVVLHIDMPLSSRALYDFFFQPVAEKVHHHQCRKNNKVRKHNLAHGYANVISQLRDEHANYEEKARVGAQKEFQFTFTVTKKASNIFSWLRWITLKGLPF